MVTAGGAAGVENTIQYGGEGSSQVPTTPTELNTNYYMDFTDLGRIVPVTVPETFRPMMTRWTGQLHGSATVNDNLRNPMVHSLNMSLTRNLSRSLTIDLRYIGSLSRNQITTTALNSVNYIDNNFYRELMTVREGGESMVINSLFPTGTMVANPAGVTYTGSEQLRRWATTNANLGRGLYQAVAGSLATQWGILPRPDVTESGHLSRAGCLPGDRQGYEAAFAADNTVNASSFPCMRVTPWNYFSASPQYSAVGLRYNGFYTNYHSMQVQATLNPTHGLNFQATYTWSRMLSNSAWTDLTGDRFEDRNYNLHQQNRSHMMNVYGSYSLPFGPSGFLLRDASGALRKAVEGWQLSWIVGMSSGMPDSVSGTATLWGDNRTVLVRPDLWDNKTGRARPEWNADGTYAGVYYFGKGFTNFALDEGICNSGIAPGLYNSFCSNSIHSDTGLPIPVAGAPLVLAVASGRTDSAGRMLPALYESDHIAEDGITYRAGTPIVVFRNADQSLGANAAGNFRPNQITGPGRFSFDMAMSKSVEFMEGKRLEVRVDAQNILNRATPSNSLSAYGANQRNIAINHPNFSINNAANPYGFIATKVGRRTFQGRIRLSF
jgi:hypothetical protein